MNVRCEVRQKDIDRDCHGGYWCPVALALRRAGVFEEVTYVSPRPKWAPRNVRAFIRDFDAGKRVKPFTFTYKSGVTR